MRYFPLILLALLFADLASLIWLGGQLGFFLTLLWVIADLLVGVQLIRRSGSHLFRVIAGGKLPQADVGHMAVRNLLIALSGLLLLIPGMVSDLIAIVLFLPFIAKLLTQRLERTVVVRTAASPRPQTHDMVIEGEVVDVTEPPSSQRLP